MTIGGRFPSFFLGRACTSCQLALCCYIILAVTAMEASESDVRQSLDRSSDGVKSASSSTSGALDLMIDLLEDVQRVISGGRPRKVKIRLGDRTIAEMPVALTAAAAFAAGLAAVLLTKLVIEVEHEEQ